MEVDFFKDKQGATPASSPETFQIQYYSGPLPEIPRNRKNVEALGEDSPFNNEVNWTDVTNMSPSLGTLVDNATTMFTFDMVESCAVRIKMTTKTGSNGLAATEIRVFEEVTSLEYGFDVTSIQLDGVDIESFNQDELSYDIEIVNGNIPTITVGATNNASATVIPANDVNGTTKLIITAENSIKTKTYTINFTDTSSNSTHVKLTGENSVQSGEKLTVTLRIDGMTKQVYSQDIRLEYDPIIFIFEGIEGIKPNQIISNEDCIEHDQERGVIRVLGVVLDGNGLTGNAGLFKFNFTANETQLDASSIISAKAKVATVEDGISTVVDLGMAQKAISIKGSEDLKEPEIGDNTKLILAINEATKIANNASIGTTLGNYPQSAKDTLLAIIASVQRVVNREATQDEITQELVNVNLAIRIFEESTIKENKGDMIEGDVNEDGKVDIADLAYMARYYHVRLGDANWNSAKKVDINGDSKIDIEDLVFVARKILGFR